MNEIDRLQKKVRKFVQKRDWEQYHSPKNLAISISIEANELLELYQWKEEVRDSREKNIEGEVADLFFYLLRMVDVLDFDLESVLVRKIEKNKERYPIEKSKGSAKKYTELDN